MRKSWSPYVVGAGLGVLSWLAFLLPQRPLGVSTAYEQAFALILAALTPDPDPAHWTYFAVNQPKIDWAIMLVVGLFIGARISSRTSGDRAPILRPPMWARRWGEGDRERVIAAFFGAALMLFGARLGYGCTTGHGLSGNLQLALSSLVYTLVFTAAAIATALAIYGRKGSESEEVYDV